MRKTLRHRGGFTLLEVMIASALGIVVLGIGLVAGMQVQRRALTEEQTMVAQVTGRAVKDLLTLDVQRAGIGMGNSPIQFSEGDQRYAIQSWTGLDMTTATAPFVADATFALPPAGTPYADMTSDVLQLYWGDPRTMVSLERCNAFAAPGRPVIESVKLGNILCAAPAPHTLLQPASGQPTPALVANPTAGALACHFRVTNVRASDAVIEGTPGRGSVATTSGPCASDVGMFTNRGWNIMRTVSAAYRVNWRGGNPALEYLAPGAANWAVVSRDVERMTVRFAVIDLTQPALAYRWFPEGVTRPAIDQCTTGNAECAVNLVTPTEAPPSNETDLRNLLRRRIREVEIELVIRTPRSDRLVVDPAKINIPDEDGFPQDGFRRRTYTLRVSPRNFVSAGLQPAPGP
ncbi:prepilin-type N-terminal cleavage/methylation domain-containing protein [Myxococcus sp. K38C18041901]|uniref:PilW family protein n=1 Tax=Myxococcus guangdongensis TaxID=2906760 RepID=UPI0020A7B1DE|nr:prepilin-type N-terminal cleavage/methylation domain-containing protein [Myxococcus guangdongensis]MCP3063028.1 prepilin-type N-terminal cleavage/methylation domain-containing protein [Myxococcus guangdongensis]